MVLSKRSLIVAGLALAFGGCGPGWAGTYQGTLAYGDIRCSDGYEQNWSGLYRAEVTVTDAAWDRLIVDIHDFGCGPFEAKEQGRRAQWQPYVCEEWTAGDYHYVDGFPGGELTLDDQQLIFAVDYRFEVTAVADGMIAGYCSARLQGVLWNPQG